MSCIYDKQKSHQENKMDDLEKYIQNLKSKVLPSKDHNLNIFSEKY